MDRLRPYLDNSDEAFICVGDPREADNTEPAAPSIINAFIDGSTDMPALFSQWQMFIKS